MRHAPALLLFLLLLAPGSRALAQAGLTTARPDTQRTASGVRYVLHQPGTGPVAKPGDRMAVHYTGFLPDGHIFDSSVAQGKPLRLRVGRGEVIPGWDEVLQKLPAGCRAWVWIPASLAYGSKGVRNPDDESKYQIPPNTDLVFELNVVKIH